MESTPRDLVDVYEEACSRFGPRDALGTKRGAEWTWTSYAHLRTLVDRCRGGLAALGVGPGDRVAIVADNRVEWAVAAYATYGLEAIFVPMYESQLAAEWKHILADSGARVVFASGAAYPRVAELKPELRDLERIVGLDLERDHPSSLAALFGAGEDRPLPARHPDPEATAGLVYTSGTTGMPKGVVLSHANLVSNLLAMRAAFPLQPSDSSLAFLPWAHCFGQVCELHYGLSQGIAIAINDRLPQLVENLAAIRPTILVAVPRIFNRIWDMVTSRIAEQPALIRAMFTDGLRTAALHREGKRGSLLREIELAIDDRLFFSKVRARFGGRLRFAISASAALDPQVAELVDALGIPVYEGYGLTETSPAVSANTPEHRKLGSVGRVLPGVRVRIDRSATGDPDRGEIVVYGPNVMKGYYRRPEETAAVMTEDGGVRSGDIGYVDDDGYLFITGRIKEQYKLENGKYVMPGPIEEHLQLSPFIANVMLYGENRPYNVALVVPRRDAVAKWAEREGVEPDRAHVTALLEREIAVRGSALRHFEAPKRIAVADEEFTTDNGMLTPTLKTKRRAVLARYREQLDALY